MQPLKLSEPNDQPRGHRSSEVNHAAVWREGNLKVARLVQAPIGRRSYPRAFILRIDVCPHAWPTDTLACIMANKITRVEDLLP